MSLRRGILAFILLVLAMAVTGADLDDRTAECGAAKCIPGLQKCGKDAQGKDACIFVGGIYHGQPESANMSVSATSGLYGNSTTAAPATSTTVMATTTTAGTHSSSLAASSSSAEHSHPSTSKASDSSGAMETLGPKAVGALGLGVVAILGLV